MPTPTTLALAALIAFAAALGLVATARPAAGRRARAIGAAGVAVAMVAGAVALGFPPRVPPGDVMDRLLLVVLPLAVVVEAVGPASRRFARPVASVAAPLALLFGSVHLADPATAAPLVAALAALVDLGGWLAGRKADRLLLALLAASALAAGAAVVVSGYATGGLLGLPLALGLAGVAAGSAIPGRSAAVPGALVAGVFGLAGLLVGGTYFAGLPPYRALLLFAAPFASPLLPPVLPDRLGPRARAACAIALAAALLALAVVPAVLGYLPA